MPNFSLSPSVAVKETDLSKIVPSVATAIGAYAGTFQWGPALKVVNIDSEDTLKKIFGGPNDEVGTDWWCAADYLTYSGYLKTVRVVSSDAKNGVASGTAVLVKNDIDFANQGLTALAANKSIAKYPGSMGNGLEFSLADADTFPQWKYRSLFSSASSASVSSRTTSMTCTGDISIGSTTLANIVLTSGSLAIGQPLVATGIPVGTKITDIVNDTTVTMSAAATATTPGLSITTVQTVSITGATTVVGSTNLTNIVVASGALAVGQTLTGTGIPTGTTIVSITSASAVVMSAAATAASTTLAVTGTVNGLVVYITTWPGAPATSSYVKNLGGLNDEIHAVVIDKSGVFTGTPGTVLEKFVGLSKAIDSKTAAGSQNYYLNVINNASAYVWVTAHETAVTASDTMGAGTALFGSASASKFGSYSATPVYAFTSGATGNSTITDANRISGFALYKDQTAIDVTLIVGGVCTQGIATYINDQLCTFRKDCVGGISPPLAAVQNNTGNEERDVISFRNALNSSSYIVYDTGWKQVYDRYNDAYRWIPLNPSTMGLCASVDSVADTWWSPAGFNRGFIKNTIQLAWNPTSKASRDNMYQLGINPVVTFPGVGTVLYGDKTMVTDQGAFSRINVRRLFILLEKSLASYSKFILFEFNDAFTRTRFTNTVTPYLRDIQGRRGIYDFKVICDESNNTPQVIDSNGFLAKFLIKPARSISFIELEFVATATGANFAELA
jgi:hypothetical protein